MGFVMDIPLKAERKTFFRHTITVPLPIPYGDLKVCRGSPSSEPDAKPLADWSLRQAGRAVTNSRPEDNHRAGARTRTRA